MTQEGATFPDITLLPEIARLYEVLVDDLFKADLQEYGKLSNRLVGVYCDTHKNDDFMATAKELERMEREGSMEAADYRSRTWLYGTMAELCLRKVSEDFDKAMELSKDTDINYYYEMKTSKVIHRVDNLGEGQQCIDEQLQAIKENPENAGEWVCLVTAYYWAKRYEECYRVVKDAIEKFPEDQPYMYCIAGHVCKELKKYDEAFAYWEKHLELDSVMLEALVAMGSCYEELGEYEKAYEVWMRMLDKLIEFDDDLSMKFPMRKAEECKAKMGR